jgi:hypothetical protein
MRRLLNQLAWAAVKARGSHFEAVFRRLLPRLGVKKAIWAVAHRMLRVIWKVLHNGVRYIEFGPLELNPAAIRQRKRALRPYLLKKSIRSSRLHTAEAGLSILRPRKPAATHLRSRGWRTAYMALHTEQGAVDVHSNLDLLSKENRPIYDDGEAFVLD